MDVLKPELLWIEGRCYRVPQLNSSFSNVPSHGYTSEDSKNIDDDLENCENDGELDMPDIEVLPNGRHRIAFPVSRCFLPFIIGSKGATIKRIENDTSCSVVTPKLLDKNLIVLGPNSNRVVLAWKIILDIIRSSRKRLSVTHFLSIPMISDTIKSNFLKFKEAVLSGSHEGVTEKLFQEVNKLHLTLSVFVLTDDSERKLAEEKLEDVCNRVIRPIVSTAKPLIIEARCLDCMNDDPSSVHVLYANVEMKNNTGLLQMIADQVNDAFNSLDVTIQTDRNHVKLHMTLMNSSFLIEEIPEADGIKKKNGWHKKKPFDVTNIYRDFKDFYFGEQELTEIHLSIRRCYEENGYYKHTVAIKL